MIEEIKNAMSVNERLKSTREEKIYRNKRLKKKNFGLESKAFLYKIFIDFVLVSESCENGIKKKKKCLTFLFIKVFFHRQILKVIPKSAKPMSVWLYCIFLFFFFFFQVQTVGRH